MQGVGFLCREQLPFSWLTWKHRDSCQHQRSKKDLEASGTAAEHRLSLLLFSRGQERSKGVSSCEILDYVSWYGLELLGSRHLPASARLAARPTGLPQLWLRSV